MFDSSVPAYGYLVGIPYNFCLHAMADMPVEAWWLPALVLLVLGAAATVDAFTSSVPDPLIFVGLVAVVGLQGYFVSWPFAAMHLTWALGAAFVLWGINHLWYMAMKHDAIGMGDAKWTMLAVATFDIMPVLFAWGIGACLGVLWMGARATVGRPAKHVYFAPFLFIGLVAGLYWLRVRGVTP